MRKILLVLFPLILLCGMGSIFLIPKYYSDLAEASVTSELPYGELDSRWIGVKRQETERERQTLAKDTEFSKGDYYAISDGIAQKKLPIYVSIVCSGKDMNASIHRPEICLPSQGHFNLKNSFSSLKLDNGKEVSFTRLDTDLNVSPDAKSSTIIHGIYYYIFIGDGQIAGNHAVRHILDFKDRILYGKAQRWAYIQIGIYYGDVINEDKQAAETRLLEFIQFLLPQVIEWDHIRQP